ncbi:hypothetical protein DYB25_010199 [Aphanomyces astaci]|uniref:Hs1pro-1 C-terminal domain-containing protein n=2 Tax=Aphanomyces astaci TaxID=112090 RepID=A0A397AHW4_APHAT|nr:hypothetical protein DYB25_010199 [Aphanomyces astaci]
MAHLPIVETAKCPHAATAKTPSPIVDESIPCAYAAGSGSFTKDPSKLTTSATLGDYSAYLGSLHRNAYASYIRLPELEKTWGLWALRSATPMPFDPLPHVLTPVASASPEGPPAALYRLVPAMSSFEMSMRLALDFYEVNLASIDNASAPPSRSHRSYVQHQTRLDSLLRNIGSQLHMLRTIIDIDTDDNPNNVVDQYVLTTTSSQESLGQPKAWWWSHTHPSALTTPHSFMQRLQAQVQSQFADLPFGLGVFGCSSKSHHLPYDVAVAPAFLRQYATENEAAFDEDHFFAMVHQICEAWCCVMERQLDAAQDDIDSLSTTFHAGDTPRVLRRIARRYRFCGHVWEYMIDHVTMLTEMDMADYHSFRLQLHGASGGQSVRMRQLRRRIFHLLPLIPAAFQAYVTPVYPVTAFNPTEWTDLLHLLAHVRCSDAPETNDELVHNLQQVYANHDLAPSSVMGVIQAVQTLENAVRRFYFGHQYMAIMVLGGGNTGSDGLTVKMLERTWKDPRRYFGCEQAKTQLSDVMDALHLQRDRLAKGKLMQSLMGEAKARRATAKGLTQCPNMKMTTVA